MTAVLLPGVYLDALTTYSGAVRLHLVNRSPEPDHTDVAGDATINLSVVDVGATPGISVADTEVYVDGVLAFDGGAFQPGYVGPSSGYSLVGNKLTVTVDPSADFASDAVVTVRVVTQTSDTVESLDATYTFAVTDTTKPAILATQATAIERVRVTFNEAVDMTTALVAANYVVAPLEVPAITPTIASVVEVDSSTVDLTLGAPLSFGLLHLLTVNNVTDLRGNAIAPGANAMVFTSVRPVQPAGRDFQLWYMVPRKNRAANTPRNSSSPTGDLRKFIACFQDVVDLLLYDIDRFAEILDPDFAEEQYLDAMLQDLGNPFEFELSEADKRRLLRVLVLMYLQKGTERGVKNVVRFFLGLECDVVPWVEDSWLIGVHLLGESAILGPSTSWALYAFDVEVYVDLTDEQRTRLRALVNYMKPSHTHFVNVIEPGAVTLDHVVLGYSYLGTNWTLH